MWNLTQPFIPFDLKSVYFYTPFRARERWCSAGIAGELSAPWIWEEPLLTLPLVSKENIGTEDFVCRDNVFFCAPEAVTIAKWQDVLDEIGIVATSVDEAHCVSKW